MRNWYCFICAICESKWWNICVDVGDGVGHLWLCVGGEMCVSGVMWSIKWECAHP